MESEEQEDVFNEQTWLKDIDDKRTKYNVLDFLNCQQRDDHANLLKFLQTTDHEQGTRRNVSVKPFHLYNTSDKIVQQKNHSTPVLNSTFKKEPRKKCTYDAGHALKSVSAFLDDSISDEINKNLKRTFKFTSDSLSKQDSPSNDLALNLGLSNENIMGLSPLTTVSNKKRTSQAEFSFEGDLNQTFTLLNSDYSIDTDLNRTFTLDTDEDNSDVAPINSMAPTKRIPPKLSPAKIETRKLSKMKAASQDNLTQEEENEVVLKNTICRASTSNLLNNNFPRNSKLSTFGKDWISTSDGTLNACHQVRPSLQTGAIPKQRLSNINNIPVGSKEGTSLQIKNTSYMKNLSEKNLDRTNSEECAAMKNNSTFNATQDSRGSTVRRFGSRLPMPVSRSSAIPKRSNATLCRDINKNAK